MKKVLSVLIAFALAVCAPALMLVSCGGTSKENPTPINTNETAISNGVYLCNRFKSVSDPPFTLPDGEMKSEGGYYSFFNNSESDYDKYTAKLKSEGFALVKMKYSRFLFRDDCMIFLDYSKEDKRITLSWYAKSPFAPKDGEGVSSSEAAALRQSKQESKESSLSPIEVHPIDVTPEGFFERTGAQMFAFPIYSYDTYKASGYDRMMFEDNERYSCLIAYIKGDDMLATTYESIAVSDIDDDGNDDIILLSFGPTSGVFSFIVTAKTADGIYSRIFTCGHVKLSLAEKDGKAVVKTETIPYNDEADSVCRYWNIGLQERDGSKVPMIFDAESGEVIDDYWGV